MSSILDALKRIENEEPEKRHPGRRPDASWLESASVRASLADRVSGFLLSKRRAVLIFSMLVIAAAFAAVVVTGDLVSFSGPDEGSEKIASLSPSQTPPSPGRKSAASPEAAGAGPDGTVSEHQGTLADTPPVRADAGRPRPVRKVSRPAPAASENRTKRQNRPPENAPVLPGAGTGAERPQKAAAAAPLPDAADVASASDDLQTDAAPAGPAGASPGEASSPAAAAAPLSPAAEVRKLPEASGLQLQAISWSEAAENRIAVINGKILREGERIEAYLVSEINRDDVVFEHQNQLWQLGFRQR